jgi:endonuclease-3 related protein
MAAPDASFTAIRKALAARYGRRLPQLDELEPFEAVLATFLDRAIDVRKRKQVLSALREEGLLEPQTLAAVDESELDETLRSAGAPLARRVLVPLQRLARWILDRHKVSVVGLNDSGNAIPTAALRDELLAIRGVGPASADAILLFALRRPSYPVDRATYRILARHAWIDPDADYEQARELLERLAPGDRTTLAELSDWFDRVGREFCRASVPRCDRCPLQPFLPEHGPVEPEQ